MSTRQEYDVQLQSFWQENKLCFKPFSTDKPRAPLRLPIGATWYTSLIDGVRIDKFYTNFKYQQKIREKANQIIKKCLGFEISPYIDFGLTRESLFSGEVVFPNNAPPWVKPLCKSIDDVKRAIKRFETLDPINTGITPRWFEWRKGILKEYGINLKAGSNFHGGIETAGIVCGSTNFCMWVIDYPDLMKEFMQKLLEVTIRYCKEARRITGIESSTGFSIANDSACLVSKQIYDEFSLPFEKALFNEFAPNPKDTRYYHADSEMSQHLDSFNTLGCTSLNLGPSMDVKLIRQKCPQAFIYGHLPPFLLRNGMPGEIIKRVKKDFKEVGRDGGLCISTAGGINEGTPIENIKAMMWAVQGFCRYDLGLTEK